MPTSKSTSTASKSKAAKNSRKPDASAKSQAAKTLASGNTSAANRSKAAKTLASGPRDTAGKNSAAKTGAKPDGRGRVTSQAAQKTSQAALNQYKMEAAQELGIDLDGERKLTRQQAGQIGGRVVKKMVAAYEKGKK